VSVGGPQGAGPTAAGRLGRLLGWSTAALLSGFASLQAAQWPPPAPPQPTVALRARPLLPEEREALNAHQQRLQAQIDAAAARLDRWPAAAELEGADPAGAPLLPDGLPDNPAADGVGWVLRWCAGEAAPPPGPDWLYCPATGRIGPAGLEGSAAGSPSPTPSGAMPAVEAQ
jgi:hypothetical protein